MIIIIILIIIIIIVSLDVLDEPSYGPLSKVVSQVVEGRGLNLLINNACVAPKSTRINQVQRHHMLDTYLVNTVAPVMLTKVLNTCYLYLNYTTELG